MVTPMRALPVLAAVIAAASVAGCNDDASGLVGPGEDGEGTQVSASVNPGELCRWRHYTHFNADSQDPYSSVSSQCGRSRQVWQTCYVALYGPIVGTFVESEDHGQNFCQTQIGYHGAYKASGARGSEALYHFRLDNTRRRWTGGSVRGRAIYCDRYFNTNRQHILRCYHQAGNVPAAAQVLSSAVRGRVRDACVGAAGSGACARAQAQALRRVDRRALRRHLDRLTRELGDRKLLPRSKR